MYGIHVSIPLPPHPGLPDGTHRTVTMELSSASLAAQAEARGLPTSASVRKKLEPRSRIFSYFVVIVGGGGGLSTYIMILMFEPRPPPPTAQKWPDPTTHLGRVVVAERDGPGAGEDQVLGRFDAHALEPHDQHLLCCVGGFDKGGWCGEIGYVLFRVAGSAARQPFLTLF